MLLPSTLIEAAGEKTTQEGTMLNQKGGMGGWGIMPWHEKQGVRGYAMLSGSNGVLGGLVCAREAETLYSVVWGILI